MTQPKGSPAENPADKVPGGNADKINLLERTAKELLDITGADKLMEKLKQRIMSRIDSKELKATLKTKPNVSPELNQAVDAHEATLPETEVATEPEEKVWYEGILDTVKSFTDPILQRISKATGIKGNDLKRLTYTGISFLTTYSGLGFFAKYIPALNFGRYKLEELEVEEAVAIAMKKSVQKYPDLKIAFAGFTPDDHKNIDEYMAVNADKKVTVRKLAQECINTKLKAGTSFTFTVDEMMMKQEDIAKEVAGTVASDRKTKLVNGWKEAGEIGEVKTSDVVSAERNGAKWDISLPESEINAGVPMLETTKKLAEAMKALTNAKKITVIGNDKATSLDTEAKNIELSANDTTPFNLLNDVLPRFNPRGKKLILATATTNNVQTKLESDSFTVYQNKDRNKGLEQIEGLYTAAAGANANAMFTYKGGSWRLETTPVKL